MGADLRWLQGEISDNPLHENVDVDQLLQALLSALIREQVGAEESQ
jgi:hypothetical protein